MKLTVIENTICQLPVQLQGFVAAKIGKIPLKNYSEYDLQKSVKDLILNSYAELSIKPEDQIVTFFRETLSKDFRLPKYNHLTMEEIKLFIQNGIRGEYGSFKGQMNTINIQNIHHWIRSGIESDARRIAMDEFNRLQNQPNKKELTEDEKKEILKRGALNRFQDYKKDKVLGFCPYVTYDFLNERLGEYIDHPRKGRIKTLVTDPEKRKSIYREVKSRYQEVTEFKIKVARAKGSTKDAEDLSSALKNLDEPEFEQLLKKEYLRCFFDSLISQGKELELK